MRNVNYKSDFDFIMRLKDCADDTKTVPFPDCDFDAMFWTSSKTKAYIASCKGGVCTNCFRTKDGDMHFVFDNQHMGLGTLHWEPHFELPNDLYPDSIQDLFRKAALDIELVDGDGDCPTTVDVELIAPFIKGDKGDSFTYDDFTTEDKAELIAPIKDNIDRAITQKQDKLTTSVDLNISEDKVLSLTERAKQRLFDDMWRTAAGEYGTVDHTHFNEDGTPSPYYLNELWLTYDEAVAVYQAGAIDSTAVAKRYYGAKIRTNLPPVIAGQAAGETAFVFECLHIADNSDIEVLNLASIYNYNRWIYNFKLSPANNKGTDNVFGYCLKLRKIIGHICLQGSNLSPKRLFGGCPKLEDVRVTAVSNDLDIMSLPKINVASIKFMIEQSRVPNDKTITITVHPDVYAKLTGTDTTLTEEESAQWQALVPLAAEKRITFTT